MAPKFRQFLTKNGTTVLLGKTAKNNEELISQIESNEIVLHTQNPGSPFVNIKEKPQRGDIKEAAILCANYSQDWRDNKLDVIVHKFKGSDIYKEKGMKLGTFGIKKFKIINIQRKEIIKYFDEFGMN